MLIMKRQPGPGKANNRVGQKVLFPWVGLLAGLLLLVFPPSALAACEEYLGRQFWGDRLFASAQLPFRVVQRDRDVFLRWLGHSSFLIKSRNGVMGLTDPNSSYPFEEEVTVVTISNDHITHSDTSALRGNPVILAGHDGKGRPIKVNRVFADLQVQNLAATPGPVGVNTVFMYKSGAICVAHLGNLTSPLNPSQVAVLFGLDVLLVPIHGWGTSYQWEGIMKVVSELKPRLVIPMHYDHPARAQAFVEFVGTRLPVKRIRATSLYLNRGVLPPTTTLLILGWPEDSQ